MLAGRGRDISQYPAFFAAFAAIYVAEPLLTRVYIRRVCYAAENVRYSTPVSKAARSSNRSCYAFGSLEPHVPLACVVLQMSL